MGKGKSCTFFHSWPHLTAHPSFSVTHSYYKHTKAATLKLASDVLFLKPLAAVETAVYSTTVCSSVSNPVWLEQLCFSGGYFSCWCSCTLAVCTVCALLQKAVQLNAAVWWSARKGETCHKSFFIFFWLSRMMKFPGGGGPFPSEHYWNMFSCAVCFRQTGGLHLLEVNWCRSSGNSRFKSARVSSSQQDVPHCEPLLLHPSIYVQQSCIVALWTRLIFLWFPLWHLLLFPEFKVQWEGCTPTHVK